MLYRRYHRALLLSDMTQILGDDSVVYSVFVSLPPSFLSPPSLSIHFYDITQRGGYKSSEPNQLDCSFL